MNLANPIAVTPPSITKDDGTIKTFEPITFTELDITIVDNPKRKIVSVRIFGLPSSLVLWSNEAYDSAGDYTQTQLEARINELLGDDPSSTLSNLFIPPSRK